jgi:hypothetical protein
VELFFQVPRYIDTDDAAAELERLKGVLRVDQTSDPADSSMVIIVYLNDEAEAAVRARAFDLSLIAF